MYKLRNDLSNTMLYDLCAKYLPEGFRMPNAEDCDFVNDGSAFWILYGFDSDTAYDVCLSSFSGCFYVRFKTYSFDADGCEVIQELFRPVPFGILFSGGYLREVV